MRFLRYILPLVAWMIFIFYISSLSNPPSPGGVGYFNEIFHFFEFFILSFLFLRMFKVYDVKNYFILAVIFSILYAITDEIHQLFVPYRAFEIKDLIIDSLGASLILISLIFKRS